MQDVLNNYQIPMFIALGVLTLTLSSYLGYLVYLLRLSKRKLNEERRLSIEANSKRELFIRDSILIMAKATLQGQCETSEACVRIKKLLGYYPELESHIDLFALNEMYEEIKDLDYLEARKKLSKQERFNQDKIRFKAEEKYSQDFNKALNFLIESLDNTQ